MGREQGARELAWTAMGRKVKKRQAVKHSGKGWGAKNHQEGAVVHGWEMVQHPFERPGFALAPSC